MNIDLQRLKILTKNSLLSNYPIINKMKNKNIKHISILILIICLIIFSLLTFYLYGFTKLFAKAYNSETILYMCISISQILIFLSNFSKVNSYVFRCKDFDLLNSLPVNSKEIVFSKIFIIYINSLVISLSLLLTSYIAYSIVDEFNVLYFLLTLISGFILPIIPIIVSSFIAFFVGYLNINKKVKSFIIYLFYFLITIVMVVMYINVLKFDTEDIVNQVSTIKQYFIKMWPLSKIIFNSIYNIQENNGLYLLLYTLISISLFILYIFIVSKYYISFNSSSFEKKVSKENKDIFKVKKPLKSLVIKELRAYLDVPAFIFNTIPGPILSIISVIIISIFVVKNNYIIGFKELDSLLNNGNIVLKDFFIGVLCFVVCILNQVTTITSSSISLEGKTINVYKSLPISYKEIVISKIFINFLLFGLSSLISIIMVIIINRVNIINSILIILIVLISALFSSILGLLCNLYFPKLNYVNKIQVVKQGFAVLLNMILSISFNILALGIFIMVSFIINTGLAILIMLLYYTILFIVSIIVLKNSEKRYLELSI